MVAKWQLKDILDATKVSFYQIVYSKQVRVSLKWNQQFIFKSSKMDAISYLLQTFAISNVWSTQKSQASLQRHYNIYHKNVLKLFAICNLVYPKKPVMNLKWEYIPEPELNFLGSGF